MKQFAVTVVKDWYNQDLKKKNEDLYNRINSCFRALQSNDMRASNYWLTQIEQLILQMQEQLQKMQEQKTKEEKLVKNICQYSSTTRSEALIRKEQDYSQDLLGIRKR